MALSEVLRWSAVPIAETDWGGAEKKIAGLDLVAIVHTKRRELENVCTCRTKTSTALRRFDTNQVMNTIVIDPSTGRIGTSSVLQTSATPSLRDNSAGSIKRTLELERARASSASKERKRRHRQPPPEQQQKPRAQQQEPDQRVEEIETKASIKQTALRSANITPKAR